MMVVVVMAAQLLALEIKLNNSHGFGLQWLLQLCIFYQANKLLKLAKGVGQEQTETMGTKGLESTYCKQTVDYYYTKEWAKTRQEIISKNTLIENLSS